ncbi:hypothetical protein F2P56_006818 [Juglans regia]|uniref:serine O-acetyltransferase n=2 Tax=Juglans regia TaxID=51240 RepID=A0A834D517_JUGRE|nr:serine acetyltransferase 1, chloroplastic-like [Juglans regia]KAF5474966.1 hypothetical protein F2P56_006818 [Juglans regia]
MAACAVNSRSETSISSFSLDSNHCQVSNTCCRPRFCRPNSSNIVSCKASNRTAGNKLSNASKIVLHNEDEEEQDVLWLKIREEALHDIEQEHVLHEYYYSSILSHVSLESALADHLGMKLGNAHIASDTLKGILLSVFAEDQEIRRAIRDDLRAVRERDPACLGYAHCLLNFKGFLACQVHRAAHKLWSKGRKAMAVLLQSRTSEVFTVDIHPGARIGGGVLLDHATGIVIGETAIIGDNVTILHNVTLGGTGKLSGDRHPKIGDGVFIGAGAKVLGNIVIGEGAKIGAGAVVLKDVPPKATSVGNPARLIGGKQKPIKLHHFLEDSVF